MAFPKFPYTDFHRLNADWILDTMRKLVDIIKGKSEEVDAAVETVEGYNTRLTAAETKANGAVRFDASQTLNSTQKAQARTNIGAVSSDDIPSVTDAVRVVEQTFTSEQKAQARTNIDAVSTTQLATLSDSVNSSINTIQGDVAKCVKIVPQTLSSSQKAQALDNIGAAPASAIPNVSDVLRYSEQSLTDAQKAQARANIGVTASGTTELSITVPYPGAGGNDIVMPGFQTLYDAIDSGRNVIFNITFEGDGQGVIEGTARVCGVFADVEQTHMWVYLPINTKIYQISFFLTGSGTTVYYVYNQEDKNVPSVSNANNGYVLTSHGSYFSWSESGKPVVVTDSSSTTPTIASAADNHIYKFTQDLTTLSLTAGTGSYMICFHSGSTATTTSFPVSILGLDDFVPETNTYYEINVMDGRAVWRGWADPVEE